MLTQKEAFILKDQLEAEQLEIEKFDNYASQVSDPNLRNILEDIKHTHERHFNMLARHI